MHGNLKRHLKIRSLSRALIAGWVVVGFTIGVVLWLFPMIVLFPTIPYPASVVGTAPFLELILWAAWLVTARIRG